MPVSAFTPSPGASAPRRIDRSRSSLFLVDFQEKLLPAMADRDATLQNALRLARAAALFALPVLATEQYRKGLGPTWPELAAVVPGFSPMEKLTFSGCTPEALDVLRNRKCRDVVLAGIESHVCVTQTALDLLDAGFRVFVTTDACSSRTPQNRQAGFERMQAAGAIPVSTEMVLFEWLGGAGTPEFKQILAWVK